MLDFLKDYQQQWAEAENKKVRILRGMNEDKKTFGRVFLKSWKLLTSSVNSLHIIQACPFIT